MLKVMEFICIPKPYLFKLKENLPFSDTCMENRNLATGVGYGLRHARVTRVIVLVYYTLQ